jgi:hypothetical protein
MAAFVQSHLLDLFLSLQRTFRYPLSRQISYPILQLIPQYLNTTFLAYKVMAHCNFERLQTCPGLVLAKP